MHFVKVNKNCTLKENYRWITYDLDRSTKHPSVFSCTVNLLYGTSTLPCRIGECELENGIKYANILWKTFQKYRSHIFAHIDIICADEVHHHVIYIYIYIYIYINILHTVHQCLHYVSFLSDMLSVVRLTYNYAQWLSSENCYMRYVAYFKKNV